jgi:hypothetical protein
MSSPDEGLQGWLGQWQWAMNISGISIAIFNPNPAPRNTGTYRAAGHGRTTRKRNLVGGKKGVKCVKCVKWPRRERGQPLRNGGTLEQHT